MKTSGITSNIAGIIEDAIKSQKYVLRLYVFNLSSDSNDSILKINKTCQIHLGGTYTLEVIDMQRQPVLDKGEQIIATATLIKLLPDPLRQIIGDFAQSDCVLLGMDLRRKADHLNSKAALAHPMEEQYADCAD